MTDDELRKIGEAFTQELIETAQEKRAMKAMADRGLMGEEQE